MMTVGLSSQIPDDPNSVARLLVALIELLSNPAAAKERIAQYQTSASDARKAVADAQQQLADLETRRANLEVEIADSRTAWEAWKSNGQEHYRRECVKQANELVERQREIVGMHDAAAAARQEAEQLKAKLARKLAAMEAA